MKKTARFLCILCVLLSMLLFSCLEAYAASISVSVSLSGHSCRYTVNYSESYTVWAQLEDDSGNVVVDYVESASKSGVTLTPPGTGSFRYVITVMDDATGEQAYGYSGFFTIEECDHSSTKKVNAVETYRKLSSTEHRYKVVYDLRCKDCGIIVQENLHDEWEEEHDFQDGVCFYCDYAQEACNHENRNTEYGEPEYVNTNDVDYHSIVTTYKVFCADCGDVVDWGKEEAFEFHEYNHDGLCFCGYYNEDYCRHDNTERRDAGYAYGVDDSINDVQHFVEHFYEEYCFDCDQVIGHGGADSGEHNPLWEGYWEDHTFTEGYCVCSYYKEPDGSGHKYTELRFVNVTYVMDKDDAEMHLSQNNYDVYCYDCEQVIGNTWKGQDERHEFDESGCCVCGYQRNEDEQQQLHINLHPWDTEVCVGEYIAVTAAITGGSGVYKTEWYAHSDTGLSVCDLSGFVTLSLATWTFEVTVTDTVIGNTLSAVSTPIAVVDHDWQPSVNIVSWKPSEDDESQHYASMTQTYDVCVRCNAKKDDIIVFNGYDEHEAFIFEPHTFEGDVCPTCNFKDKKYSLCCPDAMYTYADWVLIPPESGTRVMIRDNHTGRDYNWSDIDGMRLHYNLEQGMSMTDAGFLRIKNGSVEITLTYKGKVIDVLNVGTSWLDVTTWGWNEGNAAGTLMLRMEDLKNVAWNKTGLWLNHDGAYSLGMFEFETRRGGEDYYIVTFEIYNSSPLTYGVASYYPDGSECDRQMIDGYSPDWGLLEFTTSAPRVVLDTFSAKYGNSGVMTKKTEVSLRVPVGGMFMFLEANDDEEVAMKNVMEVWMSMLVSSGDYLDWMFPGDSNAQDAVKKALKDPKTWREFRDIVAGEMIEKLGKSFKPKDILSLTRTGTDFFFDLLENDDIGNVLFEALRDLAIEVTWGTAKSIAVDLFETTLLGVKGVAATKLEETVMEHVSTLLHLNSMMDYASDDLDVIQLNYVFAPNDQYVGN